MNSPIIIVSADPLPHNPDILWRNTSTGENYVWYMDGVTLIGSAQINTVPDTDWQIVGIGDFNGDGN